MPKFDVVIAGELNLDILLYGLPAELAPERELVASDMVITLGGSSTIVAHNLAVLGNRVGFISRIGKDSMGQIALDRLAAAGRRFTGAPKTTPPLDYRSSCIMGRSGTFLLIWERCRSYPLTIWISITFLQRSTSIFHRFSFRLHCGRMLRNCSKSSKRQDSRSQWTQTTIPRTPGRD